MARFKIKIDGTHLRLIRKEAGYTQEELAEALDLSRETISAIERNKETAINSITIDVVNRWRQVCERHCEETTIEKVRRHIRMVMGL